MLNSDAAATAVPVDKTEWKRSFPHLEPLIDRIGKDGRYDPFELIKLKRWSAGKIAVIGDAAHALPPNIGQGGGCAMMNALALAVHLDQHRNAEDALAAWEATERPLTDHTQRVSVLLGLPTTWPPTLRALALKLSVRSKWLLHQRTRIVYHQPTGT
jgi:2-polyprenyl-6-methoxyphenol hydroxylase-like FAD-dependent oxidoreductase